MANFPTIQQDQKLVGDSSHLAERGVSVADREDDDVKQERENVAAALLDTSSTSPVLIYVGNYTHTWREKRN